ncbi:MAG: hypothetical protein CSA81_07880 [Acidobacteria bacterium]|nr:MAG: hypothetical protein CSA81_07880 [Acidobacteriota bacterium]
MIPALILCLFAYSYNYLESPNNPEKDLALLRDQSRSEEGISSEFWEKKLAVYTETGELQSAKDVVKRLLMIEPDNKVFWEAHIVILGADQKYEEALRQGERFIERFPEHPTIRVNLARLYSSTGRHGKAINILLDHLEFHALNDFGWEILLDSIHKSGKNPVEMMERLNKKIEAFPDLNSLKKVYFVLLIRFGAYDEAYQWLTTYPELKKGQDLDNFYKTMRVFHQ